eukprot:TRINITY_DN7368_c0_g1_i1.p1 TRINITY_DN7368_c0_g1~~TRINITY_DN7368_c0_g1_i1.p1  ORF type:complete len:903 (+),score=239.07 TRINITY_DN7368_c0_g1_i1:68-2776(+)
MTGPLRWVLAALLAPTVEAGLLRLEIAGGTAITETDVRRGGREVLLKLEGDTWILDWVPAARHLQATIESTSSMLDEPAGFMASRETLLPIDSIVLDSRHNDFSVVALVLQPLASFNLFHDEVVYIPVPANATTSGQITYPEGRSDSTNFQILAGKTKLQAPALITEDEVRAGGLQLTLLLLQGEQFESRGEARERSVDLVIDAVTSSLDGNPDEQNTFRALRHSLLAAIGFDIVSTAEEMTITLQPDPTYNFYADTETVRFTLPPSFFMSTLVPTPVEPLEIVIQNSPGSVWLRMPPTTEAMMRSGTASLIIVLKHDRWNLGKDGTPEAQARREELINSFEGTTEGGLWNAQRSTILQPDSIVLLDAVPDERSEQRVEVRFNQDVNYILRAVAADEVEFFIPASALLSQLPPKSLDADGNVGGALTFSIQAMGDVQQIGSGGQLPEHSGDLKGLPNGKPVMQLTVRLTKDRWAEDTCADYIRSGFSSDQPDLPNGFMAKLDRIVNPAGLTFTPCTVGNTCELTIRLTPEESYSALTPANLPKKEVITVRIPPQCVSFGVQPSGSATMTIEPHPSEVSYNLLTPGTLEKPEVFGLAYEDRPFYVEAWYGNKESWKGLRLVNSLSCSQVNVARYPVPQENWGKCGELMTCLTSAKDYPDTHSIRLAPAQGQNPTGWMPPGTWSVCTLFVYSAQWVRVGDPITVEVDPTKSVDGEVTGKASDINPMIVAGMLMLLIVFFILMYHTLRVIWAAMKKDAQDSREEERRPSADARPRASFRAFGDGAKSDATVDEYWENVLQNDEELPDMTATARYAFAEYGEQDPRVEFLKEPGMEQRAFLDDLQEHKGRLADIGVNSESEGEEEEEYEEVEEEDELEGGAVDVVVTEDQPRVEPLSEEQLAARFE